MGEVIVDSVRIATAHLPPRKRYEATFKCSFDLGSKKHRILDEQYTNGKNYVDISRFDLGDMLRRYADGAEHVKSREELMKEAKKNGRERRTSERDAEMCGTEETEREEKTGKRRARRSGSGRKEEEKSIERDD